MLRRDEMIVTYVLFRWRQALRELPRTQTTRVNVALAKRSFVKVSITTAYPFGVGLCGCNLIFNFIETIVFRYCNLNKVLDLQDDFRVT